MYQTPVAETTAAVTKAGQISLPKAMANNLGITYGKDRVHLTELPSGAIIIRREPTFFEKIEQLHETFTPEEKAAAKALGRELDHKSVGEYLADWGRSPEGQAYFKEKYGI